MENGRIGKDIEFNGLTAFNPIFSLHLQFIPRFVLDGFPH